MGYAEWAMAMKAHAIKSVTAGSPVVFCKVAVPIGSVASLWVRGYTKATSGAEFQVMSFEAPISIFNKGGAITGAAGDPATLLATAVSTGGPLSPSFDVSDAGSGVANLRITAQSDLGSPVMTFEYSLLAETPNVSVTPL